MIFEYEQIKYSVNITPSYLYNHEDLWIELPNGSYVRPSIWLESYPPIPEDWKEIPIALVNKSVKAEVFEE